MVDATFDLRRARGREDDHRLIGFRVRHGGKKSFALRAVQSVREDIGLPNEPGRALLEVLAC
jgi:hypothetical protein